MPVIGLYPFFITSLSHCLGRECHAVFTKISWAILIVLLVSVAAMQVQHHYALQGSETAYGRTLKTS
ncbi:MAG: hypothetical protein ACRYGK_05015 [Janthinobacterium lividum]